MQFPLFIYTLLATPMSCGARGELMKMTGVIDRRWAELYI